MITLVVLLTMAGIMLAISIQHQEPILMGISCIFGLFVAYSYGRYVETKRAIEYIRAKFKEADRD